MKGLKWHQTVVNSESELEATRQLCYVQFFNHYFWVMRSDASMMISHWWKAHILHRCSSPSSFQLHLFTLHTWSVTSVIWKGIGWFCPWRVIFPQSSKWVWSDRENTRHLMKHSSWRASITESYRLAGLSSCSLTRSWGCEATAQQCMIYFTMHDISYST